MKTRGISIAALAIACVFVVTAVIFAVGIYSDYNSGLKTAAVKFEKLSSRTAEASEIYASGSREFIGLFNSAVGSAEVYESINLKIDGKDVYVYPMENNKSASAFVKTFSTRIVGGDGADIRLDANIHTVSPSLIYYRAKIAFIIILAGTLLTCILLLSLYLGESAQDSGDIEFKKTDVDDEFGQSLFDEEEQKTEQEEQVEETSEPAPETEEETEAEADSPAAEKEEKPEEEKVDFNPLENAYEDQNASEQSAPSPIIEPSAEQGLFSPASGFGWESYLSTRLESELVRAASSEQDLALALIKIPGMTKESDYYGNICQTLQNFFQYKDFIFERGEDGFAAIMQHCDVDTAMQNAEVLHSNIAGALKTAGQSVKPLIGISSRSLRLISAERLKNEADQALLHASEDADSPIIAFRVNPEKYRKYIGGQGEEGPQE